MEEAKKKLGLGKVVVTPYRLTVGETRDVSCYPMDAKTRLKWQEPRRQ